MTRHIDDGELQRLLEQDSSELSPDHIRRVRASILVAAHNADRFSWAGLFGFRPALLIATGLLGFVLGVSLPALGDAGSTAGLEDQPQSFLTGDFG